MYNDKKCGFCFFNGFQVDGYSESDFMMIEELGTIEHKNTKTISEGSLDRLKDTFELYHQTQNTPIKLFLVFESRESDMVIFMNRRTHFFGNRLSKPLLRELDRHSIIPVLEISIS